jgi:glycosyltransferase involved in cell wall biosynthesis
MNTAAASLSATIDGAQIRDKIPRIFHLIWLSGEAKPRVVQQCIDSWQRTNPTFDVREWSLKDLDWEASEFCRQAVLARKWAFATDVLRLKLLESHGGVYLDSDVIVHGDVGPFLCLEGFIPWEDPSHLGPHVIGATKGNKIISSWLSAYDNRQFLLGDDLLNITPMPDVITQLSLDKHGLNRLGAPQVLADGFHVLDAAIGTSKLDESCIFEHLYQGGWLPGDQNDFRLAIANRNRRFKVRYRTRLKLYHWMPALEPIFTRHKEKRQLKDANRARRINLWYRAKASELPADTKPPLFWHVTGRQRAISAPAVKFSKPLVSIIVPVYNVEDYVARTVKSLLDQTYKDIEILLVNDGATDSSPKICQAAADADPRVKLLHKTNGGLGSARNHGLEHAQGEFISFVDGDDWVSEKFIERFLANADPTTDIVVCDHAMVLADGRTVTERRCAYDTWASDPIINLFVRDVECYAWNKLYRRECFDRPDFRFGVGFYEDFAVVPAILGSARKLTYTREIDYFYVQRPKSMTAGWKQSVDAQFDIFQAFDRLIEKQPFFRHDLWGHYYEYNIPKHVFLYRKDPINSISDRKMRRVYIEKFGRELGARMPYWAETEPVQLFIKEGKSYIKRAKRLALVREFMGAA